MGDVATSNCMLKLSTRLCDTRSHLPGTDNAEYAREELRSRRGHRKARDTRQPQMGERRLSHNWERVFFFLLSVLSSTLRRRWRVSFRGKKSPPPLFFTLHPSPSPGSSRCRR